MKQPFVKVMLGVLFTFIFSCVYAAGDFNAKSWNNIETEKYNKIIKKAYSSKKTWVKKPEFYAHYLLGLNEAKKVLYSVEANSMEMPMEFTVKLKRTGLLDDSVSGDIHIFVLQKTNKGYWTVVSAKRASNCWRAKSKGFQSRPCP